MFIWIRIDLIRRRWLRDNVSHKCESATFRVLSIAVRARMRKTRLIGLLARPSSRVSLSFDCPEFVLSELRMALALLFTAGSSSSSSSSEQVSSARPPHERFPLFWPDLPPTSELIALLNLSLADILDQAALVRGRSLSRSIVFFSLSLLSPADVPESSKALSLCIIRRELIRLGRGPLALSPAVRFRARNTKVSRASSCIAEV